jgi:hypothetical protein
LQIHQEELDQVAFDFSEFELNADGTRRRYRAKKLLLLEVVMANPLHRQLCNRSPLNVSGSFEIKSVQKLNERSMVLFQLSDQAGTLLLSTLVRA